MKDRSRVCFVTGLLLTVASVALAQPLDVDGNGEVDPFTDVVYVARFLFGLPPVPPSFRTNDPNIPSDEFISEHIEMLAGTPMPTRTFTPVNTSTRTPSSTSTPVPTNTPPTTGTLTRTFTPMQSLTSSPTVPATSTRTDSPAPTATRTLTRTQTSAITRTPSPTPQLDQLDVIEAAAELSVTNPGAVQAIDFGCAAANCSRRIPTPAFRLAAKNRAAGGGAQLPGLQNCSNGGSRNTVCDAGAQTVTYINCVELTASGHTMRRHGTTRLSAANRDFCEDQMVRPGVDRVRVELLDYFQVEYDGATRVAEVTANLTDAFDPTRDGCAGAEGTQQISGSIEFFCEVTAESLDCPQAGVDLALVAHDLTLKRRAGGSPCELGLTLTGQLDLENRESGAQFSEDFMDFLLTEAELAGGATRIKQDGGISIDCLGALIFTTKITNEAEQSGAMVFPSDAACPVEGVLEVRRAPLVAEGGSGAGQVAGSGAQVAMELRHDLFRSANGKVYQVLQNIDSNSSFGAEAVQITTLVGSEAGSVGACENAAGATSDPQAVAAAESGRAFPPSSVYKSQLIAFVSQQPCFNRNANNLDGRLCIGSGCIVGTCICPIGASCTSYTIGGDDSVANIQESISAPITGEIAGVPAAHLVESLPSLADPCSGFGSRSGSDGETTPTPVMGRSTYRFGEGDPTTETRQCELAPSDGFRLGRGVAIAFAYDTPLTALFNAGFGGFPVDENRMNLINCNKDQPTQVLHLGVADLQSVPAPLITFLPDGRVQFDYDGDGNADRVTSAQEQCRVDALAQCQ